LLLAQSVSGVENCRPLVFEEREQASCSSWIRGAFSGMVWSIPLKVDRIQPLWREFAPALPVLRLECLQAGGDLPMAIDWNQMHTVESFRVPDSLDQLTCDRHACSFVTINSADDGLGDRKLGDVG
jgi:hypothetical protein